MPYVCFTKVGICGLGNMYIVIMIWHYILTLSYLPITDISVLVYMFDMCQYEAFFFLIAEEILMQRVI